MSLITAYQQRQRAKGMRAARGEQEQVEAEQIEMQKVVRAEEAARARRQQIREARVQQAAMENVAGAQGVAGSSAPLSAGYNLASQARNNIQDIQQSLGAGFMSSEFQRRGSEIQTDMFNLQQPTSAEIFAPVLRDAISLATAPSGGGKT